MNLGLNRVAENLSRKGAQKGAAIASEQADKAFASMARQSAKAGDRVALSNVARATSQAAKTAEQLAPKAFDNAAVKMNGLAAALKQTGNAADAKTLKEFAARLKKAGGFAGQGNGPAAFRMLHAKNELGLRNPAVEDALKRANKAQEVLAAFPPIEKKAPVKLPAPSKPFAEAATKMNRLATALNKTGNAADAKTLKDFAARLKKAGQLHAQGNGPAAFRILHAKNTLGMNNPAVKDAIRRGHTAEDVLAAFGKKTKPVVAEPPVSKPFGEAAKKMTRLSDALGRTGNAADAKTLKEFGARLKKAGQLHAKGNGPAAFRILHAKNTLGMNSPAVKDAIRRGHTAEDVLAAFGKKTRTAARSAEGSTEGVTLKGASKVRKPRTPKSTDRVKKAVTTKRTTAPRSNQPAHETKPTPSTHRTTRPAATHRKPAPAPAPAPAPKPAVRGHRSTNGTTHVRKPHGGTKPAPAPAPIPAPGPKPAPTFDASAFVNVVNAKPLSDYVDSMRAAAGLPVDHPTFDGFRLLMSTNQPSVMAILAKAGS